MKLRWIFILFMLSGCTIHDDEKLSNENLDMLIESGVKNLNEKTTNFNIFDRPYFKVEKTSHKSLLLSKSVDVYSVSPLTLQDTLHH